MLKRYGWIGDTIGVGSNPEFGECKVGDYVRVDDLVALLSASTNTAIPKLRDILNEWSDGSDLTNDESNAVYRFVSYVEQLSA